MHETVCLLVLLAMLSGGDCLQLNQFPASCFVGENVSPGTRVYSFNVTLSPSASPVSFGFPLIVNSSPLTQAFCINGLSEKSFEVVTTGNPPLDFETMPKRFQLQVYVKDEAGAMDLGLLTVQLKDVNEPPLFLDNLAKGTVELYILEGISPRPIYQMEAVDPENEPLTFSLISPLKHFNVSTNGILFSTTTFDFEAGHNSYVIDVEVEDSGGLKATRTFLVNVINVNDESPYFTSSIRIYRIPEELSPGTIVANITAKDPDDEAFMGRLLYQLTTPNEYFIINQLTGTIQIASRLNRDAGKLKQNPNILLEVLVKDRPKGGQENRTQITFIIEDINDNPSACNQFTFSISVPEQTKKMVLLDLVDHCFDNDAEAPNNQFNFTNLSGVGSNGKFFQDSDGSGKILLMGDLDYEDSSNLAVGNEYALIIQVQDIASPYYKNTIYIYIHTIPENEHLLQFDSASYVFEVLELKSVQSRIGQVHARDEDYPQSDITYSILTGGSTVQYMGLFWINPKTGVLQLVTKADFESVPQHILTVQATNREESSTATVTVNILDENDEKPICEPNFYFLTIPVDLRVGTNIQNFKLTCIDKDSLPTSFRYFIGQGNKNNHFTFSPNAGSNITSLLLATPFDYSSGFDKAWDYKLLIYITDDNLLTSRKKAEAFVQTGTVTLHIQVVPQPTTVITTTSMPRITYLIQRENVYSSSAWYVPFIITMGSMLLLGLLGYQFFLLVKFIRRHCSFKPKADKESLVKKGETKKAKREVVLEMTKINTVFDGEALDPVTGKIYEFNSKSGARRWKNPSLQIWSGEKDLSEQGAVWTVANGGEGMNPLEGTNKETDGKTGKMEADDISVGLKSDEGKMESSQSLGTSRVQKSREGIMRQGSSPVLLGRASPKIYPHSPVKTTGK